VSDQDFFFDDDEPKPAKSAKSAKPTSGKAAASKGKPSGSSGKPAGRKPAADDAPRTSPPSGGTFMNQSIGMPIASLLVVIGLLVGVIVGFFMGGAMQSQGPAVTGTGIISGTGATGTGTTGTGTTGTGTGTPGQLTPDQIQQGLPAGHPSVPSTTTAP
jgi:hypothetical protein